MVVVVSGGRARTWPYYKQKTRRYAIIRAMSFAPDRTGRPHRPPEYARSGARWRGWRWSSCCWNSRLVVARYLFGLGSIWATETVIYAHATLFMLAAAWTLRAGGHVRVDVFYAEASPRAQGDHRSRRRVLLLLPFALVLVWLGVPYAARSWAILERSQETSGLPLVFVLKTLIPLFAFLMALQGIAQAIRALARLARPR